MRVLKSDLTLTLKSSYNVHMSTPVTPSTQVAFFAPEDGKGKWHAAWMVSHTSACGSAAPLSQVADRLTLNVHDGEWTDTHPLACKRCLTKVANALGHGFTK